MKKKHAEQFVELKKEPEIPIPQVQNCESCRFWRLVNDNVNECRRNAPSPVAGQSMLKWSITQAGAWCGQWELKA